MAASSSSFVAGHYNVTWNGIDIGTTENGYNIIPTVLAEVIRIDDYGDAPVDGIYRGQSHRITAQLSEWSVAGAALIGRKVFDDPQNGVIAGVGKPLTAFAKALVLTPLAGINSNSTARTYPLAIPLGDHGGFSYNTRLRRMTINLLCLVNRSNGVLFTDSGDSSSSS